MLRSTSTRPIIKTFVKFQSTKAIYNAACRNEKIISKIHSLSGSRPRIPTTSFFTPITTSLQRYATKDGPPFDKIDTKAEKELSQKQIKPDPSSVSAASSVRQVFEASPSDESKADVHGGIRGDFETIKDTFALTHVPREAYLIGGAGVLPYLATSLSTVYLAFDINRAHASGQGFLFSADAAHQLLETITPIQIGYGAVIISFLGAIHWGLEFAGYGGHHSYRRYAIGVVAPAVAWPTMLMPIEYALITQFIAFNALYFVDARATVRGWCPPWYSTYRFVLTFVVGASIVVSLVGRGQIAEKDQKIAGPVDKMKALRDSQWENLEKEERERRQRIAKEEEEADKDEDEDNEEESDKEDKDSKEKNKKGDDSDSKGDKNNDKGSDSKGDKNNDKGSEDKGGKEGKGAGDKEDKKGGDQDKKGGKDK